MTRLTHVLSVDLVPPDAMTALKLRNVIDEVCAKNPTYGVSVGPLNEIVLHGVSELQLEMAVDRLKRREGLDFKTGGLQVRYLERITTMIEWDYIYKKQSRGTGEYAKVRIRFEPGKPESGFVFENAVVGDAIPEQFIPSVEKGLGAAKETGVIAGFPVIDLKCTLIDGDYHDVDSSERTFEIAARACFREATPKASPRLIEPIMTVMVLTPEDHIGDVIGDLNSRRGVVRSLEARGEMQEISALVPCANLFGYESTLLSMTRGSAQHMMAFDHYETLPPMRGPDDGDTFPPAIGMRA
jgi:elongation factor G